MLALPDRCFSPYGELGSWNDDNADYSGAGTRDGHRGFCSLVLWVCGMSGLQIVSESVLLIC